MGQGGTQVEPACFHRKGPRQIPDQRDPRALGGLRVSAGTDGEITAETGEGRIAEATGFYLRSFRPTASRPGACLTYREAVRELSPEGEAQRNPG